MILYIATEDSFDLISSGPDKKRELMMISIIQSATNRSA